MEIYKNDDYVWEEHELTGGFQDYKNPKVANVLRGYPSDEFIRLGVVFYDKTGRPFFARHLLDKVSMNDIKTSKRNESGYHYLKHYSQYTNPGSELAYMQHNGQVISLMVSNLDISDVKDEIGGFSIVRAPIVHTTIGSAILCPVYLDIGTGELKKAVVNYLHLSYINRRKSVYVGYSPELIFGFKGLNIEDQDELENISYLKPYRTTGSDLMGYPIHSPDDLYDFFSKYYEERNAFAPATENGQLNKSHKILYSTNFDLGETNIAIDPRFPNMVYVKNTTIRTGGSYGLSSRCTVFVIDSEESDFDLKGKYVDDGNDALILLCNIKRRNDNPYGGLSDASLANSIYISTGHYQEITPDVLSEIEKDGKWIFDEIQVFGGDTFVNLMPIERVVRETAESNRLSHSIVFPCESIVNIAMRGGDNVAKNLPYHTTKASLGIRYQESFHKWEEFNYNDGYSSDDLKDFYLAVPYNWKDEGEKPSRIRYSLEKSYGELRDSFRVFPPLQYIDLEINDGEITNLREKFNRLIYWQRNVVGYIPIRERALTQNPFGQPIQLGVGGIFERSDKMLDRIGNINQFGIIESDIGFHWFDSLRRILVKLTNTMEFSEDSVISGMDNFFSILPDFSTKDNPLFDEGINAGYDEKNKTVFFTFHITGEEPKTIGINLKLNAFLGHYSFPAISYMNIRNNLVGLAGTAGQSFYLHSDKKKFGNYYGSNAQAYFDLVFVPEDMDTHVFDNIEISGSENICSKILYDSYNKEVVEQILSYNGEREILSRNWNYRNNKWYGNIPFHQRQRLINDYLRIRFIFDSGFDFDQYITIVKVIYRKIF